MNAPQRKVFKEYTEQVDLLLSRGLLITDADGAKETLSKVNYYRLSGYWYPFRKLSSIPNRRENDLIPGSTFEQVLTLYRFDEKLRRAVFQTISTIELAVRSILGHELGRIDPYIHLHPNLLGPLARHNRSVATPSPEYQRWLRKYNDALNNSREDFVQHYREQYAGRLPIWAAVEILDFGALTFLYKLSPLTVQEQIATNVGLSSAQFGSWMKSLNIIRNYSAHHARMFNRVYALRPRLPHEGVNPDLDAVRDVTNRCFGQLTMIQYLLSSLQLQGLDILPTLLRSYPNNIPAVPIDHLGVPADWEELSLWQFGRNRH